MNVDSPKPKRKLLKRTTKKHALLSDGEIASVHAEISGKRDSIVRSLNEAAERLPDVPVPEAASHVNRLIIYYASLGFPEYQIAKTLRLKNRQVAKTLSSQSIQAEVARTTQAMIDSDMNKVFRKILPEAVMTAYKLMTNEKEKSMVRLDAAKHMMDRALGKPKETMETKTTLISQVFDALRSQEPQEPFEAEFTELARDNEKDPLEGL